MQMDNLAGFIERVKECNVGLEEVPTFTPFLVDGNKVGLMKPRCAGRKGAGEARRACKQAPAATCSPGLQMVGCKGRLGCRRLKG